MTRTKTDVKKNGRPLKYGEKTATVRVPVSLVEKCKTWIKKQMKKGTKK